MTRLSSDKTLPSSLIRRLPGLGYALSRLDAGVRTLYRRTQTGTLETQAMALLVAAHGGGLSAQLSVLCGWRGKRWEIVACQNHPFAADDAQATLNGSMLLRCAALHLPSLRLALRRELRFSRFDRLLAVLPQVWWLTEEAIPPGAIIAGLGLTSWASLPQIIAKGRSFECVTLDASGKETKRQIVNNQPGPVLAGDIVLLRETTGSAPFDGLVKAHYAADESGRWTLLSAEQRLAEPSAWQPFDIVAGNSTR